jgi:hypothetical protein
MFFSLSGLWLFVKCYKIVALKDARHHRGKGTITLNFTLPLCPSDEPSERFRGEMTAKDLDAGLGNRQVFVTQYFLGPSCAVQLVSGSDLKTHLTFQNYVDNREWNPLRKDWSLF